MLASMTLLAALFSTPAEASPDRAFHTAIDRVEAMTWSEEAQRLAAAQGLSIMNVTWEDTGRSKGSSVGPNISDMTIGVRDASGALHPMPVLRFDNFHDKTADVRSDRFWLRVGNEDGRRTRSASLADVLQDTRSYLHDPGSWAGRGSSLWTSRDEHVLVSAQAAFLPVPRSGEATFTPVLYNYQSSVGNPAVLTIVATREGTSIQVVENDNGYMSEVLYFNEDGQRAPFTATRLSDFKRAGGDGTHGSVSATGEDGLNTVLVVQVPLKHRPAHRYWGDAVLEESAGMAAPASVYRSTGSDVEQAVIGHGPTEGPFTELHDLAIERDARFPVRVTVQFYKATSNGIISASDVRDVRKQIDRVYSDGDYVGSLVSSGHTSRPTEWTGIPEAATWADRTMTWMKP